MKHFVVLLLLGVCFHVPMAVQAQKISMSVQNAPLRKVFKEISNQTGYNFLYASQLLAQVPKASIEVKDASIFEVLDLIFKGMSVQYEINDNTIVISPGKSLCISEKTPENPNKIKGGGNRKGHIEIKAASNKTIIYLNEEFELCKVKNGCLLFMSSYALGKSRNPMQNKRILKIELIKDLDEMIVFAYGATIGQISILRGDLPGVKVVLLTDLNKTSAIVTVGSGYKSGSNFKRKAPSIKRTL